MANETITVAGLVVDGATAALGASWGGGRIGAGAVDAGAADQRGIGPGVVADTLCLNRAPSATANFHPALSAFRQRSTSSQKWK